MPRFRKLDPAQVHVGKGKDAAAERKQFVEAIRDADAGRIDLESQDKPGTVKGHGDDFCVPTSRGDTWRRGCG